MIDTVTNGELVWSGTKTLSQSHDGEMNSDREDEVIHKYTDRSSTNMMMP